MLTHVIVESEGGVRSSHYERTVMIHGQAVRQMKIDGVWRNKLQYLEAQERARKEAELQRWKDELEQRRVQARKDAVAVVGLIEEFSFYQAELFSIANTKTKTKAQSERVAQLTKRVREAKKHCRKRLFRALTINWRNEP